jgi:hypothetical protein
MGAVVTALQVNSYDIRYTGFLMKSAGLYELYCVITVISVPWLGVGYRRIGIRFPAGTRNSHLYRVQTGCRAHSAAYTVGTEGRLPQRMKCPHWSPLCICQCSKYVRLHIQCPSGKPFFYQQYVISVILKKNYLEILMNLQVLCPSLIFSLCLNSALTDPIPEFKNLFKTLQHKFGLWGS